MRVSQEARLLKNTLKTEIKTRRNFAEDFILRVRPSHYRRQPTRRKDEASFLSVR